MKYLRSCSSTLRIKQRDNKARCAGTMGTPALSHAAGQNTQPHDPAEGNLATIHTITNVFTVNSTISFLRLYPKDAVAKIWSDLSNTLFTTVLFEPEKDWEHKDSSNKEIPKESMIRPHSGTPCSHEEEWERSWNWSYLQDIPLSYTSKVQTKVQGMLPFA